MRIYIYNYYGEQYEIKSIEYTQFNGKDTIIDYSKESSEETYTVRYEGWLSLQEIINIFIELGE